MAHVHSSLRSSDGIKILLVVVALLLLGAGAIIIRNTQQPAPGTGEIPTQNVVDIQQSTAQTTLIYGTWEGNQTIIHGVNADGTAPTVLATLPFAIKNIRQLPDNRAIYIADTDAQDHGLRIAIRDLSTGDEQTVVQAISGRGIDSYVVSADSRWIAYWEVQLGPDGKLNGGRSYVFTAKLDQFPADRTAIFDESAQDGAVVHYPLFFDHNGMLYTDGFSPNKDGWNQGLVQTAVTGSSTPASILPAGSYNSDPELSPATNTMVYTAYDPAGTTPVTGDPSTTGKTGKQALNPNMIALMDLNTGTKATLLEEPGRVYYDLTWKDDGSQLFARSYGSDGTKLTHPQALVITLHADGTAPDITHWDTNSLADGIILGFGADGVITGTAGTDTAPGNIGATYQPILSGFAVSDGASQTTFGAAQAQYIGLQPGALEITEENVNAQTNDTPDSLKLGTFNLKTELNNRPAQQNDTLPSVTVNGRERCRDIYAKLVGQQQTTTGSIVPTIDPTLSDEQQTNGRDPSLQLAQFGPGAVTQTTTTTLPSFSEAKPMLRAQYKCYDSPLYVYSVTPQPVTIHVGNATILSSSPVYQPDTGWQITGTPEGTKVDYSYTAPFTPPTDGYVVKSSDLKSFLGWYGTKLGLVNKELIDYINFWTEELGTGSEYIQVSHFDTPDAIMHLDISPKPGTLLQAIMYFKPLSAHQAQNLKTISLPVFPDVPTRTASTTVDWSGIIDR